MAPPHEPRGRVVSVSERLYRALLAAYPNEFRRSYGREMAQVFRCMCREEVVSGGTGGLARLWVRTLLDLLATALAERAKQALGISTLVGSSSKLGRWSGLAAAAGGVLLIVYGVLSWVSSMRTWGVPPTWTSRFAPYEPPLMLVHKVGYLLFLGGLAGLFGLLERARRARPRQTGSARSLSLAYCSAVAGLVTIGLAAAATVVCVVQLSTVGNVLIEGGILVAAWRLMGWGPLLGILLLGMAVLRWGLLGRWSALPLAVGLLMSPLQDYLFVWLLYLVTGSNTITPTFWPDWPDIFFWVVPNAIVGTSWVLLGWVIWSGRDERLGSGVEGTSL